MAQKSFAATVDAWTRKSDRRMSAVFKEGAQRVIAEAQRSVGEGGRMRVDTGFLRASGQVSLDGMPQIRGDARPASDAAPGSYGDGSSEIALSIAGASIGDTIYFGYTASYAAAREYGARGQPPDAFVRTAASKWQGIVRDVIQEAKRRYP